MLDEIKKLFVHGYLEDADDNKMFRANGKLIPINFKKTVSEEAKAEELPVSDNSCNIQPVTPELTEKEEDVVETAVETLVAVTEDCNSRVCNEDPTSCQYATYSPDMQGWYYYFCHRLSNPQKCDVKGTDAYVKHYTEIRKLEAQGQSVTPTQVTGEPCDDDECFTEDDFVEEEN